jgi:hypothetical protein
VAVVMVMVMVMVVAVVESSLCLQRLEILLDFAILLLFDVHCLWWD